MILEQKSWLFASEHSRQCNRDPFLAIMLIRVASSRQRVALDRGAGYVFLSGDQEFIVLSVAKSVSSIASPRVVRIPNLFH